MMKTGKSSYHPSRRQSTIGNPFEEIIKSARTVGDKSSPKASLRSKENTEPQESQAVVKTPSHTKKRRSAPSEMKSHIKKKIEEEQGEDPEKLKKENAILRREIVALKARVQARQYQEEQQEEALPRPSKSHQSSLFTSLNPWAHEASFKKKTQPCRRSSHTKISKKSRRSVGSVSRSDFLLYANPSSQPFIAFAVYGAAANDGECAARLPTPAGLRLGHRYRPTQLCTVGSSEFEWSAFPSFVFPDGVPLELVPRATAVTALYARSSTTARIAALTRGYLVCYITKSAERFARPHAVHRTLRGDASLFQQKTSLPDDFDSPLAPALHLLPPAISQTNEDDVVALGQRAYIALTLSFDRCADCLRFLRRTAARDRRADAYYLLHDCRPQRNPHDSIASISHSDTLSSNGKTKAAKLNTRWHAEWDNDVEDDDDDDDDGEDKLADHTSTFLRGRSPRSHLSFQAPARLESFVCRARDDPRVWAWLTQEEPKCQLSEDSSRRRDILRLTSAVNEDDDDDFYWTTPPLDSQGQPKPLAPPSSTQWSVAALLALVPAEVIARAVCQLVRERSLIVVADDVARAGAVALGLSEALAPLSWQGTIVMNVPANETALLGSPVPFIAGCSTATAAVAHASFAETDDAFTNPLNELCVLYVDRQHDAQFVVPSSIDTKSFYSQSTLQSKPSENESLRPQQSDDDSSHDDLLRTIIPAPPRLLAALQAAQAKSQRGTDVIRLLCGLDPDELEAVTAATIALRQFILDLLDDLARGDPDAYRNYGQQDLQSGIFNFEPSWFVAKLKAKFDLQAHLANTQMLQSYIDNLAKSS